jgi:hypothetical protein
MKKRLSKTLFLVVVLFAPFLLKAQTTEYFEGFTAGATSFTSGTQGFTLTNLKVTTLNGAGVDNHTPASSTGTSNQYLDDLGNSATGQTCSIKATSPTAFTVKNLYYYVSDVNSNTNAPTADGTITFTGKLGGVTQFTETISTGFNTSFTSYNGFNYIDFSTPSNYTTTNIDELDATLGGSFIYMAIDNFTFGPAVPTVASSGTPSAFTSCSGTASTAQSFTVSGTFLTANLVVTPPVGFEVSLVAGSGYGSSLSLTPSSGTVATTTIYTRLTSSASGSPSGNITLTSTGATTKNVAVSGTVYTATTAGISGGSSPICYNTAPGTFTATGGGGNGSFTYLWYKNGVSTGTTTNTYTPGALTSTSTFYCAITSTCGTTNTSTTTITVDGNLTAGISGGSSPICYNTDPGTFTATGGGGTGTYTYLWYKNGVSTGVTTQTYDPGSLTATTTVYCAITSGTCGTVNTSTTTITVDGNLTAGISGGSSPICYNTAPGTFTATGGGGTGAYTYLWYKNGVSTGTTTNTYSPGALTATSTFYCAITSGTCGTVNTSTTTITVDGNLTAGISGGTSPLCYNTDPGTFTATGGGGTGSYTYLWYKNSVSTGVTTQTYDPGSLTATSTFYCAITSGTCGTVNTSTTTITVDGNLTAGISGGSSPLCYNTDPGTFTATGGGGTGTYTYLWYKNSVSTGVTTQTYDPGSLTATSTFYCAITSGSCGTVNTSTTTITVDGNLTAGISGGTSPLCYNSDPGSFTATGGGGTGTYTYLWYKNGVSTGTTTQTYDPGTLTATSTFYCAITSGSCGTVNTSTTTITVDGNLTAGISGGTTPLCYNTDPGTFTATGGGGTGSYTYLWYKNGVSTSVTTQTYDPGNLTATSTFYCAITSGTCGTVNTSTTTITVDGNLTAGISGGSSPLCYNTDPGTFTATGGGGTGSYTYLWYLNGISTGITTNTYDPGNLTSTSTIYCAITSGSCGTVNTSTTTITVDGNLTAGISGGSSPLCYNSDPGIFTATGGGGTGSYTYLWYLNGVSTGVTTNTYDPGNLTSTSTVYCAITSGSCGTVNTSTTTITIDGNLTAGISGGTSPSCYNTDPGTLTATGGGGTGSYTYLWYMNGVSTGATTNTYDPGNLTATANFYCAITSGSCGTVNTSTTTITVDGNLTAGISGGTSPICATTDPGMFTATGGGGTGSYTYLWYMNGVSTGVTTQTYDPGNIISTSTFYCAITSGSCGTVNTSTTTITVNGNVTAGISGGTSPLCYNSDPGLFTATGGGGTGTFTYLWYMNGVSTGVTTQTYDPGNLTSTATFYCAITSGTGACAVANSSTTTITIYGSLTAGISGGTTPICANSDPGTFTASGGGGTGSYTYLWYMNGVSTGVTTQTYDPGNLTSTSSFYCAITSGSCGTMNSSASGVTVNQPTTGDTTAAACNSFKWYRTTYTSSTSTPTEILTNKAGCDSTVTLHLTINPSPTITVSGTSTITAGSSDTLTAKGGVSYTWTSGSTSDTTMISPLSTTTYTVTGTDGNGCTNTTTFTVTVTPLGINNLSATDATVLYPNPAFNSLTLSFKMSGTERTAVIEIMDITGKEVSNKNATISNGKVMTLDISALSQGIYFVKISTNKNSQVVKFIKQ